MTEPVDSIGEMRGKLVRRLAIAAVLVVFLMATLAVFDYLSTPEEVESPVFSQPVPVPPKKEISQPVTPAENLPEPPVSVAAPAAEGKPAEEPPPPSPSVTEPPPAPAVTPGASALPRGMPSVRPQSPATETPRRLPAKPPAVPLEQTEAPTILPPPTEKPVRNAPREMLVPKAQREVPVVSAPALARLFSGFLLQAGVFSSAQRAEELHARLTLSGIPSSLETRVQVGPFRTRQEAEAAQEKLRSLGVETVLVTPKGATVRH